MVFGLYASAAGSARALSLTLRSDDIGSLGSERLTIALALIASLIFLAWRLAAVIHSLLKAAS